LLRRVSFVFFNLHILDEPFDDFFVCAVVVLNVFVQLLAQRQIFGVQLFAGFPAWVRVNPVLNALDLITGCQVNEFLDVGAAIVLDPLVRLHVHGLTLDIRAVDRAFVHVHALQVVNNDGADPFNDAVVLREFQILQGYVERFHKIAQFNGVLAFRVQKHLQVELLVRRVVVNHRVSLLAHLYELGLQCFVLLHQLFHHLHHEIAGCGCGCGCGCGLGWGC